jgi:hypothetical protein
MSTVTTARVRAYPPGAYDHLFYSTMSIVMAVVVFAGFAPTFYLRSQYGAPVTITGARTLSTLAVIHGTVFTAWVLLFVIQTSLVAARRLALHRRLGLAGVGLAIVMVVLGTITAIAAGQRGSAPAGFSARVFLIVPLTDMLLFGGFFAAAVRQRRNKEAHKRLMLLAYVNLMLAAVARLPTYINPIGPLAASVFIVMLIAYDVASRRRVHPVYWWGGALFLASLPARFALANTHTWQTFAAMLIG